MAQVMPSWLAVPAWGPLVVTTRSSVRLPKAWSRVVKPVPWVTVTSDAPAAKRRSWAWVVFTAPLLMDGDVPAADALTSTGDFLARPEYSCRYRRPNELIAVPKLALTVFGPPRTLEA